MIIKNPYFCNYWVTYRCNSSCRFCYIWKDPSLRSIPNAKFEDVKRNLDDLKKIGVKVIDFTGGEPLLNKDISKILSYAKKLGFFVKLSTNGFLYPEKAEELKGFPNRIYISFDTTSSEEYKKIRGINGFDEVIESIHIAKSSGQDLCLVYTVTDENINNISNICEFAKTNRVIVYIHPCFSYFENRPLKKENIRILKKYFWQPFVRMNLPQLEFHLKGGNDIQHPSCKAGKSTVDIGPDDCVTIPCFHRHLKKIKINGNLHSLYNSKEWIKMFEGVGRYDFCQHCTIDCYFGLSYWDRVGQYFLKQNISFFKDLVENLRN
jgi:MoaA/NifB/PqqE/SkfB family radical SAM enzyme